MPRARHSKEMRDKFLEVYKANRCLLNTTCVKLKISKQQVEEWIRLYPEFQTSKKEAEDLFAELVENRLIDSAIDDKKPNTIGQIFYLKHNTEKYDERMENKQFINVEQLWFNKSKDTKQIESPKISQE